MRVKTLERNGSRKVLLVYPTTLEEYRQVLETLGRADGTKAGRAGDGPAPGRYVVTTEEQRPVWGLPDVTADALLVDEAQAFEVLWRRRGVVRIRGRGARRGGRALAEGRRARRGARGPCARSPGAGRASNGCSRPWRAASCRPHVHAMLRHALQQAAHASGVEAVEKALARTAMAVTLPWRTHAPARFDPVRLRQGLDRTHAGLDRVKSRLVEALATSRRAGGLLTVEAPPRRGGAENVTSALLVRPRPLRPPVRIPCLAGPGGTGRRSLALAAAEALGRPHVRVTLGKDDTTQRVRGHEDEGPGCILRGLREAGVRNPVSRDRGDRPRQDPTWPRRCATSSTPCRASRSRTSTSRFRSTCPRSCGS